MSERLDVARRLELSDVSESGDAVEGTFRGVKVGLEDHGLERTLTFHLGRPVRWTSIGLRTKEVNDPDVVQTGDQGFDATLTVLADDGAEPTVRAVFDAPVLRQAMLDFFLKFPNAVMRRGVLTMPHVAAQKAETSEALERASRLVNALRAAMDETPEEPLEAPPVIPYVATEVPVVVPETPDPRDVVPGVDWLPAVATVTTLAVGAVAWVFVPAWWWLLTGLTGVGLWVLWKGAGRR